MLLNDKELSTSLDMDYAKVVADFHSKEEQLQALEHRDTLVEIGIVTAITLLILLWIIRLFVRKNRRAKVQIEKQMESIRELRTILDRGNIRNTLLERSVLMKDSEIKHLYHTIRSNLSSKFDVLDNLLSIYYENKDARNHKQKLLTEIDNIIREFSSDSGIFNELVGVLNEQFDGVYTHLISDFPRMKEVDRRLFVYTAFGFSTSSIALFLNVSDPSFVYTHRSRMKSKFEDSDSEYAARYLDLIG